MKKITLAIFIALFSFASFAQKAKKPTIMVVPSNAWCSDNGFVQEFNNQGTVIKVPDYKRALESDQTLLQVITLINGMMADRGFPLKDLESALKTLETEAADDNMRSSSTTGGGVSSSPTDKLKQVAKADIWMQITYNVIKKGPQSSIQFTLRGLDAYTDKQEAYAVGNGEPSSGSIPELMQEAVLAHLDNFNASLMTYFEDMSVNGREVVCRIKVWDDWGENLETEEYGDDELGILIEGWMSELTVNGVFNLTTSTENIMLFEQVRIPLFATDDKGNEKAYDVRALGKDLRNKLKTVGVEAKAENDGLGKVTLWIGQK